MTVSKISMFLASLLLTNQVFAANWEECKRLMPTVTGDIGGMVKHLYKEKIITEAEIKQTNILFQRAKNCDKGIAIYFEFIYSHLTDVR